jgi:hypothetical protein
MNNNKSTLLIRVCEIGVCCIALCIFFFEREFLLYRDFSYIWHGALLVTEGYSPWKDFVMPVSPISIYFTGLFLMITEKSWFSLQIFQLLMNFVSLILACLILSKYEKDKNVIRAGLIVFTALYLLFLTHPWYNNFGAFFLLLSIYLANYHSKPLLGLAGITVVIAFASKPDFGAMAFLCSSAIIFYQSPMGYRVIFYKKYLPFLLGVIGFFLFYIAQYDYEILEHSLDGIRETAGNRGNRISRLLEPKYFLLIFLGLWVIIFPGRQLKHFFSYGLIILSSAITAMLGGLVHTHYYYVFVIPAILFFCYQNNLYKKHLYFIVPIVIVLAVPMLKFTVHLAENTLFGHYESEYFNSRNISSDVDLIELAKCSKSFKNVSGPRDVCDIFNILNRNVLKLNASQHPILNVTELRFLDLLVLGIPPIKNHPLWYKTLVTSTPELERGLLRDMQSDLFSIILIQRVPLAYSNGQTRLEMIQLLQNNTAYYELPRVFKSPMCAIGDRRLDECGIKIYVNKDLSSDFEKIYN